MNGVVNVYVVVDNPDMKLNYTLEIQVISWEVSRHLGEPYAWGKVGHLLREGRPLAERKSAICLGEGRPLAGRRLDICWEK